MASRSYHPHCVDSPAVHSPRIKIDQMLGNCTRRSEQSQELKFFHLKIPALPVDSLKQFIVFYCKLLSYFILNIGNCCFHYSHNLRNFCKLRHLLLLEIATLRNWEEKLKLNSSRRRSKKSSERHFTQDNQYLGK